MREFNLTIQEAFKALDEGKLVIRENCPSLVYTRYDDINLYFKNIKGGSEDSFYILKDHIQDKWAIYEKKTETEIEVEIEFNLTIQQAIEAMKSGKICINEKSMNWVIRLDNNNYIECGIIYNNGNKIAWPIVRNPKEEVFSISDVLAKWAIYKEPENEV